MEQRQGCPKKRSYRYKQGLIARLIMFNYVASADLHDGAPARISMMR